MARRLLQIVCAALVLGAGPAAHGKEEGAPANLLEAFQAICVDPGDDPSQQTLAATSPPWNFVERGGKKGVLGGLVDEVPLQATIDIPAGAHGCGLTTMYALKASPSEIGAVVAAHFGLDRAGTVSSADRLEWPEAIPDGRWMTLSVRPGPNNANFSVVTLASFLPNGRRD